VIFTINKQQQQLDQMSKELDLVFLCDCTSSMSSYLQAAKQNIQKIVEEIVMMEKCDVQFALVEYRDHPPQDTTFAARTHKFTSSVSKMREYVNEMQAQGGGDGPESVVDGLWEALNMDYRKDSAKIVVCISDAPPHGLGESGDGFPDGCPCKRDPIEIAKQMAERGIIIYAVGVEPTLSNSFKYARDFMMSLAKITDGQFLPLSSANLLAKVIVGGAIEEISLNVLMQQVDQEVNEMKTETGKEIPEEEVVEKITKKMKERKIETNQLKLDSCYSSAIDETNVTSLSNAKSLKEVRGNLKASPSPSAKPSATSVETKKKSRSSAPRKDMDEEREEDDEAPRVVPSVKPTQSAEYFKSEITKEQVSKMVSRNKKQSKSHE